MAKAKTILFADDDQILLTSYSKLLEKAGYHVIKAHDGLAAMKNLFLLVPDLLILDLMMPKFEGEELLQMISSSPQLAKVPVVILSSKCSVEPEHEHLIKLAAKYLVKRDCTPAIFLEAVRAQFAGDLQEKPASLNEQFPRLNQTEVPQIEALD